MRTNEELAAAIQAGETEAINQLWEQCKGFIYQCAFKWARAWRDRPHCDTEDFVQCGYFALCDAVSAYQAERGSFLNFLYFYLKTEFSKCAGCRTGAQMKEPLNNAISLDAPASADADNDTTLGDTIPGNDTGIEDVEEQMYRETIAKEVRAAVHDLPERKSQTIEAHYLDGKTYEEIAAMLGVSGQWVAQLSKDGLKELRTGKHGLTLWELLGRDRNLYNRTGFSAWKNTGCSVQEWELLRKERMIQGYGMNTRQGKIRYCVRVLGMDQGEAEALFCV